MDVECIDLSVPIYLSIYLCVVVVVMGMVVVGRGGGLVVLVVVVVSGGSGGVVGVGGVGSGGGGGHGGICGLFGGPRKTRVVAQRRKRWTPSGKLNPPLPAIVVATVPTYCMVVPL